MGTTVTSVVTCPETRSKILKRPARKKPEIPAVLRGVIPPVGDRRSWGRQQFSGKQNRIAYRQQASDSSCWLRYMLEHFKSRYELISDRPADVSVMPGGKKIRAVLIIMEKVITFVPHPSSENSVSTAKVQETPASVEEPIHNRFGENGVQRWTRDTAQIVRSHRSLVAFGQPKWRIRLHKSAGRTAVVSHLVPAKYMGGLIVATDRVTAPTEFSCSSIHLIDSPALTQCETQIWSGY